MSHAPGLRQFSAALAVSPCLSVAPRLAGEMGTPQPQSSLRLAPCDLPIDSNVAYRGFLNTLLVGFILFAIIIVFLVIGRFRGGRLACLLKLVNLAEHFADERRCMRASVD